MDSGDDDNNDDAWAAMLYDNEDNEEDDTLEWEDIIDRAIDAHDNTNMNENIESTRVLSQEEIDALLGFDDSFEYGVMISPYSDSKVKLLISDEDIRAYATHNLCNEENVPFSCNIQHQLPYFLDILTEYKKKLNDKLKACSCNFSTISISANIHNKVCVSSSLCTTFWTFKIHEWDDNKIYFIPQEISENPIFGTTNILTHLRIFVDEFIYVLKPVSNIHGIYSDPMYIPMGEELSISSQCIELEITVDGINNEINKYSIIIPTESLVYIIDRLRKRNTTKTIKLADQVCNLKIHQTYSLSLNELKNISVGTTLMLPNDNFVLSSNTSDLAVGDLDTKEECICLKLTKES